MSALIADCLRGCRAGLAARAAGSCCRSAIPGLAAGAAVRPDIASPAAIALVCEISMSGRRVYQPSETTLTKHTRPEAVPSKYGSVIMNTHRAQSECGFTHYFTTERNGRFLNSTSTSPRIQAASAAPAVFLFLPALASQTMDSKLDFAKKGSGAQGGGLRNTGKKAGKNEQLHGKEKTKVRRSFSSWFRWTCPKWCLIDPRTSKFFARWDVAGAIALFYTAFACPYEVAFLEPEKDFTSARFIVNRVIDIFFFFDMVLQIFVMYPAERELEVDPRKNLLARSGMMQVFPKTVTEMVKEHDRIALHYLKTWAFVDIVSVATVPFDIIPMLEQEPTLYVEALSGEVLEGEGGGEAEIAKLRILRFARVLRLIKLVRVVKASRILVRWQTSISIDFSTQTMIKCLFGYIIAGHWFACILVIGTTTADTPLYTWRGFKGYCIRTADPNDMMSEDYQPGKTWELQPVPLTYPGGEDYSHLTDVWCVSAYDLWAMSYYWMIMLISGASGGDTDSRMTTPSEALLFTALTVIACLLNSTIVASLCDVLSNMNPEGIVFRNNMDQLNRYCRMNRLATPTRVKLREFLYRAKHVQMGNSQKELMQLLSHKHQGELSLQVNGPWLTSVPFLQGVEMACSVRIAMTLDPMVFVPTEMLPADALYNLNKGTVVHRGSILLGGSVWGEDCILNRTDLRSPPARALTYADVQLVTRVNLLAIINEEIEGGAVNSNGELESVHTYPLAAGKLRWTAVKLALRRLGKQLADKQRGTSGEARQVNWSEMLNSLGSMEAADPNELAEAEEMARHLAKLEEKEKRRERSMSRMMTSKLQGLGRGSGGRASCRSSSPPRSPPIVASSRDSRPSSPLESSSEPFYGDAMDPVWLAEAGKMAKHLAKLEEQGKRKERSMRGLMTSNLGFGVGSGGRIRCKSSSHPTAALSRDSRPSYPLRSSSEPSNWGSVENSAWIDARKEQKPPEVARWL